MPVERRPRRTPPTPAALGFRVHSGWAALVALTGTPRSPTVIARRRVVLADPAISGSKQPYHAAEKLNLKAAEKLVSRCRARTRLLALRGLRSALDDLRQQDHAAVACGLLLASGRPTGTLAATLASHALIHTAEGQFFREALIHASQRCRLPLRAVKERELFACAAAELRIPADELPRRLTEFGRSLGPPWSQDEKFAALVACLALAARKR